MFCDATNKMAVERVYGIKGRDAGKPLQVAVRKEDAGKYGVLTHEAKRIIDVFWPGDVNIVVEKTKGIPDFISEKTVCLTSHKNKVTAQLVKLSSKPLVSTSANFTGHSPAVWAGELDELLVGEVDLVLDGGATHHKRPNTIVDLTVKPARIIREGPVTVEQMRELIEVA
jgi:L-threonylcarbamoyladenylate synthase